MMFKKLCVLLVFICSVNSLAVLAVSEAVINTDKATATPEATIDALPAKKGGEKAAKQATTPDTSPPEVGKHVMANMNPASMILSLFLVLGLIIVCAVILKRFNITQQGVSQLKVVSTLRLGTKERLIVVQVGEKQLLLGVTNQQISVLDTLAEPLTNHQASAEIPKNILSFLTPNKSNV